MNPDHAALPGRHLLRFKGIPDGYRRHNGKGMPVDEMEFVDVIVKTAEGLGYSGPMRARLHDWNSKNHPGGIGAVVGYKVVPWRC